MKKCTSCSKYYDENVNGECPYCNGNNSLGEDIFDSIDSGENKTVPYPQPKPNPNPEPQRDMSTNRGFLFDDLNDNKTVVITNGPKKSDIAPVVGWFVIVKGEGIGSDLRIVAGMNSIGRGKNNKIVLNYGDNTISNDHATVIYDYKNNMFFFQHGGGQNLSYINDSVILQPVELKSGDVIGLGDTELMFIPLCTDKFKWNKEETYKV